MTAEVLVPTSADEAVSLYGDGAGITVFAGGTILLPEIAAGRVKPERALMLHRPGSTSCASKQIGHRSGRWSRSRRWPTHPRGARERRAPRRRRRGAPKRHARRQHLRAGRRDVATGRPRCAPDRARCTRPVDGRRRRAHRADRGLPRRRPWSRASCSKSLRPVRPAHRARAPCGAAMHSRTRSQSSLRARTRTAASCGSASAASGPDAVRCRSVEQSLDPGDVLSDLDPIDDAVASAAYRRSVLPKLVREALDQLERA